MEVFRFRGPNAALAFGILSVGLAVARPAAAQSVSASDSAAAQALFEQAKQLMAGGHAAEACPKLEESQRLDPASGTLLNLARCYEQSGRLASAWTKYLEAASAASASGNVARESEARTQAAALRPRLSVLVISVGSEAKATAGLEITRDGERVGDAQWGLPIPADEGEHTVTAKAPGRAPWQSTAVVKGEATTAEVTVPELAVQAPQDGLGAGAAGAAPASAPAPDADGSDQHGGLGTQRIVALVVGGVGVVGLGVGTVFGLKSKSDHDEAAKFCKGSLCTDPAGVTAGNDAHSAGNVATVGMVVGLLGVAGGVALWLTAPKSSAPPAQVGLGFGSVQLKGAF